MPPGWPWPPTARRVKKQLRGDRDMQQTQPAAAAAGLNAYASDVDQYLTFCLGQEEYGIEILKVQEIKGYSAITPIPNTPAHVKGVMNLRGTVIPVVDLRSKFA